MDTRAFRAEFPVLARCAYLNAGTDGPLSHAAEAAARAELGRELAEGRAASHFQRRHELGDELRAAYARALGCAPAEIALTTGTTEGIGNVVAGLGLGPGDEILTSDEEHPGLLGPLAAARERGVEVRMVPFARIAEEEGPRTALIACSHVSWMTGAIAPAALAGARAPVLLDGAQGVGAVPVDVQTLGCGAYAGAGQKWLCGPDGSGMLYLSPELCERLAVPRRGYGNLGEPGAGLDAGLKEGAARFDAPALSAETLACAAAGIALLERQGWAAVHERAATLATLLEGMLAAAGREPVPRGPTTLVSFPSADAEGERVNLAGSGVVLRNIPDRPWLRASVGAWNDEGDLERLLGTLAG